jgi:putative spermidine/putrescine transport system permease protein
MTMPLLVAMQWLGVDATGQRSTAKRRSAASSVKDLAASAANARATPSSNSTEKS